MGSVQLSGLQIATSWAFGGVCHKNNALVHSNIKMAENQGKYGPWKTQKCRKPMQSMSSCLASSLEPRGSLDDLRNRGCNENHLTCPHRERERERETNIYTYICHTWSLRVTGEQSTRMPPLPTEALFLILGHMNLMWAASLGISRSGTLKLAFETPTTKISKQRGPRGSSLPAANLESRFISPAQAWGHHCSVPPSKTSAISTTKTNVDNASPSPFASTEGCKF